MRRGRPCRGGQASEPDPFLPVVCYMLSAFATLTILSKNSLMENLGQDYVRTAFAKGLPERRVIFLHALRNSLIPIVTGLGNAISLVLAGSFLIERVFNIEGVGLLGFEAIQARDFPVVMGILVISSVLVDTLESLHLGYPKVDEVKQKELEAAKKVLLAKK